MKKWKILYRSLAAKIFIMVFAIISIIFLINSFLHNRLITSVLEETMQNSLTRSGDLIKKSLHRSMLYNDREGLYETITIMGHEPGIERIRMYNKEGEIKYSSDKEEIGEAVDMEADACYACHSVKEPFKELPVAQKARIFKNGNNERIMALLIPIYNSKECSSAGCHEHSPQKHILGVLDIYMSLSPLDLAISKSEKSVISLSFIFLFLGLTLVLGVLYVTTLKPVKRLTVGTEKLASGQLDYRLNFSRRDELGILAKSFNNMADNLQKAYDELKTWSKELEKRVDEKTQTLELMHKEIVRVEKIASLGKMAATVAHELNNPLAGILNYSKLLHRKIKKFSEHPETDKILDQLNIIGSEAIRCGDIVNNLLVFARESKTKFEEVGLDEVANRALKLVAHKLKLAEVESHLDLKTANPRIICDSGQIMQAFVALFINATEAMPAGGRLDVTIEDDPQDNSQIKISITDTGTGMEDDIIEKIFEPFFSTKNEKNSMGLGLSVVHGIVKRHNGDIIAQSCVGEGTNFVITLPKVQI